MLKLYNKIREFYNQKKSTIIIIIEKLILPKLNNEDFVVHLLKEFRALLYLGFFIVVCITLCIHASTIFKTLKFFWEFFTK